MKWLAVVIALLSFSLDSAFAEDYFCTKRSWTWFELQTRTADSLRYQDDWFVPRVIECLVRESDDIADVALTDSMRILLESLADDELVPRKTRVAAVKSLHVFGEELELVRLRRFLQHEKFDVAAASGLVKLGYIEESAPTLIRAGELMPLIVADKPELVEPLLRNATQSGAPDIRMKAAYYLSYFGDSLARVQVARDILDEYVVGDSSAPDAYSMGRASNLAYSTLSVAGEYLAEEDIPRTEAGIRHELRFIRGDAFYALARAKRTPETSRILKDAARNSPYEDIRTRAARYVH